jgi:4-amino-4-deoxy-L-arabinose transferase-like glycosyltransferase
MSRKRRRIAEAKKTELARPSNTGLIIPVVAAIVLAGIPFALGKYIEFNSPGPYDSAANVYSAQNLLEGAQLGVAEQTSAQPATLLVNVIGVAIFGFNETGPKLVQMLLQLGALVLMFYTVRKIFGSLAAVVSVTVASIYLSAPVIAKFGNVKEQYMIAFMVTAVCCLILHQLRRRWWLILLSGAAAINAFYFKPTGFSVLCAIVIYLIAQPILKQGTWRQFLIDIGLLIAGALLGVLPIVVFFHWQGQLSLIMRTLPFFSIMLFAPLIAVIVVLFGVVRLCMWLHLWSRLKEVRPVIWIAGIGSIVVIMIPFIIYFIRKGELVSYFESISFVRFLLIMKSKTTLAMARLKLAMGVYVGQSHKASSFSQLSPIVMRYYAVVILPIFLAVAALITRLVRFYLSLTTKVKLEKGPDRFVLLLAVWWILDMAFVWISPRSYEQYYLPLSASAAMLGGYGFWLLSRKLSTSSNKMPWAAIVSGVFVCMIVMSWQIFFGLTRSPFSGTEYPEPRRGYAQRFKEASRWRRGEASKWQGEYRQSSWEAAGDHIRERTTEEDKIYVWGWVPGIYVRARRLSPAPKAFESDMHVKSPKALSREVATIMAGFEKKPPKFIVDTRKRHFPWGLTRQLELWPWMDPRDFGKDKGGRFVAPDKASIAFYDAVYVKVIEGISGPDEVARYEAMRPLRQYVMNNYRIVRTFGPHVLFERKEPAVRRGPAR